MKGADPKDEHEEHEGGNEGNHEGKHERTLKPTRMITHVLDPRIHKVRYTIHDQLGTIQRVAGSSP